MLRACRHPRSRIHATHFTPGDGLDMNMKDVEDIERPFGFEFQAFAGSVGSHINKTCEFAVTPSVGFCQ